MEKYFIAYGTNINYNELTKAFPDAKILSYGYIQNYALEFVGYDGHAIATLAKSVVRRHLLRFGSSRQSLGLQLQTSSPFPTSISALR